MPEGKRGGEKQRWDGGYWRRNAQGKKVYVIYKKVHGKLYEISTRATSSGAAHDHFKRFQADPEAYATRPVPEAPRAALLLGDLASEFLDWSRDAKGNTKKHRLDQQRALDWWEQRIGDVDLRKLTTSRVVEFLDGAKTGRKQLIASLKTFYGWLRKVRHTISTSEDPLFGQIPVPQAEAAQNTRTKAISLKEYRDALAALEGWPHDVLTILGATGWHFSEIERFSTAGRVEAHAITGEPVLFCPMTKRGNHLRTRVGEEVAEAARRLRTRGACDYFDFRKALRATGATFNPGYMRHSVATWAIDKGEDPSLVSAFLNHRSHATSKKFYATHAVPAKIPTLADE